MYVHIREYCSNVTVPQLLSKCNSPTLYIRNAVDNDLMVNLYEPFIKREFPSCQVLWSEEDGVWYDYDLLNGERRRHFYPSNLAPLWTGTMEADTEQKQARFATCQTVSN